MWAPRDKACWVGVVTPSAEKDRERHSVCEPGEGGSPEGLVGTGDSAPA